MNNNNLRIKKLLYPCLSIKKIAVVLICFSMLLIILTGCEKVEDIRDNIFARFVSEKEVDSAVNTVETFLNHLINQELEEAYNYIYIEDGSSKKLDDFIAEFSDVTQIVSYETNWVEIKNNIAIVEIDLIDTYDNEEKIYKGLQVSLVKDDNGEWKINFWY